MRKALGLILEDVSGFLTGKSIVGFGDFRADPWIYPTDFSRMVKRADYHYGPFDERGVPLFLFQGAYHYNPSRIAGHALARWNLRHRPGAEGEAAITAFLAGAAWFASQSDARFEYAFPIPGIPAPWLSCIAQGQALSVLARAYVQTGETRFLDQAAAAITPLTIPIQAGGLLDPLPDGSPFFEEYPGSYPHVLNGCLHTLLGLDDLDRVAPAPPNIRKLYDDVVSAVADNLEAWDRNGWSLYDYTPPDRRPNLNTLNYHIVHAALLRHLAMRTGNARMADFADRWEASRDSLFSRITAFKNKVAYRVAEGW